MNWSGRVARLARGVRWHGDKGSRVPIRRSSALTALSRPNIQLAASVTRRVEVTQVRTVKAVVHACDESVERTPPTKPFVRWAGGKTRLLESILPYIPEAFVNYHEPFLGSGAVFFAAHSRASGVCLLSDLNSELVNAWNVVRSCPDDLIAALAEFKGRDSEEDYYVIRSLAPTGSVERAARFFYLNQTSWNALWRVNRWGVFNVPWGARKFRGFEEAELKRASRALAGVGVVEQDFRAALEKVGPGDFVCPSSEHLAQLAA